MLSMTRFFGVTASDKDRDFDGEQARTERIVERVLLMQAQSAAKDHDSLRRGTHAKGVTARARLEVHDVTVGRDRTLGARLAQGMFRKPGIYPAIVRFANSNSRVLSDFKPDVRSLSFSVDLTRDGTDVPTEGSGRQDFSLQNATTLPINDSPAFLAIMKLLTASNPAAGLWSLSSKDKLRVLRTLAIVQRQTHQKIKPYQQLRYWSNVPFRHGPVDVVKHSAIPSPENPASPLQKSNPKGLQGELIRHLEEDSTMSGFDIGLQFLDAGRMTYWGKHQDASFWIENASVEWHEAEAPFHTVARLTLLPNTVLDPEAGEEIYFDVTGNSTAESTPLGSINRARWSGEVASRKARLRADVLVTAPSSNVHSETSASGQKQHVHE